MGPWRPVARSGPGSHRDERLVAALRQAGAGFDESLIDGDQVGAGGEGLDDVAGRARPIGYDDQTWASHGAASLLNRGPNIAGLQVLGCTADHESTRARVEGRLDRGQRLRAGVVDQNSRDPVFAADAQKPAPGAADVAAAGGPGFRREQADGDDIDRAVH